jgi:ferredoxin-nitrate reductase
MRESFGCDGQVGSYLDFDCTSCFFMVGHNMSHTQSVLWARVLDRLCGPQPPTLIVLDPRSNDTAKMATVHLANRAGTNLAVLNGILHLLIAGGYVNQEYVSAHCFGFDELKQVTSEYTPEHVQKLSGVPAEKLREAARLIGSAPSLVSTALQGVYQSHQATASACALNNINLILGQIGKPGGAVFQFNGQPTAQNNRETGCNGEVSNQKE